MCARERPFPYSCQMEQNRTEIEGFADNYVTILDTSALQTKPKAGYLGARHDENNVYFPLKGFTGVVLLEVRSGRGL